MGEQTDKVKLFASLNGLQGVERMRAAVELVSQEIRFLLPQLDELVARPSENSVAALSKTLRDMAVISDYGLHGIPS